jgi:hypothetical protein
MSRGTARQRYDVIVMRDRPLAESGTLLHRVPGANSRAKPKGLACHLAAPGVIFYPGQIHAYGRVAYARDAAVSAVSRWTSHSPTPGARGFDTYHSEPRMNS